MRESVRYVILSRLTEYIQTQVDQLCEEALEFYQDIRADGDEYDGWTAQGAVIVDYRVDVEVSRTGTKSWWFHGDLAELIDVLDREGN